MNSVAIIVYNYESTEYLRACLRQIRRYAHADIKQHIYVSDQSSAQTHAAVLAEFAGAADISFVHLAARFSGYAIDHILRFCDVGEEFLCCMDVDAFPIHKNWLHTCVTLLRENNLAFVGGLAFESLGDSNIYPSTPFFSMSPFFCVGRTADWREMALAGGFTRYHERPKVDPPLTFTNDDWERWAAPDYINRGSDDCVPAWVWADKYREHNKLALAITDIMGVPGEESGYGRILDDIIFHFGFCYQSIGVEEQMGQRYANWKRRIAEDFSDELIDEMLSFAREKTNITYDRFRSRSLWDGKLKKSGTVPAALNERINELKNN